MGSAPVEPGVYRDCRGDLWVRDDRDHWMHAARQRNDGSLSAVLGAFTGWMHQDIMAKPTPPGAEVLPLTRLELDDVPDWLREELPRLRSSR